MRSRAGIAYTVLIGALAGCATALSPPTSGLPPSTPLQEASRSRTARDVRAGDLLYVSDLPSGRIYIFSYPSGKLFGKLSGFDEPRGECVDTGGDVFVTDAERMTISEYAHAASKPKAVLRDPGFPADCSVDPGSGDLAVANIADRQSPGYQGNIAIFRGAHGKPKLYSDPDLYQALYCTYDNRDNLFVVGKNFSLGLTYAELLKGEARFTRIRLKGIRHAGAVQWDGKSIALRVGYRDIDRLSGPKVTGTTVLNGPVSSGIFWIEKSAVVVPQPGSVGMWPYPRGGRPLRQIGHFDEAYGTVVSRGSP
jgi:hypothetical protein